MPSAAAPQRAAAAPQPCPPAPLSDAPAASAAAAVLRVERRQDGRLIPAQLEFTYPQKLVVARPPRGAEGRLLKAYYLGYGGGVVGGDRLRLDLSVGAGASALVTAQSSTKAFRARRPGQQSRLVTSARVEAGGLLVSLPQPTVLYRDSLFAQTTSISLASLAASSLLAVDWYTAGRPSQAEHWHQTLFESRLRLLEDRGGGDDDEVVPGPARPVFEERLRLVGGQGLQQHMRGFAVLATVVLAGPQLAETGARLRRDFGSRRTTLGRPGDDEGEEGRGDVGAGSQVLYKNMLVSCVDGPAPGLWLLRVAAATTQEVMVFLQQQLGTLGGRLPANPFDEMLGTTCGLVLNQPLWAGGEARPPAPPRPALDALAPTLLGDREPEQDASGGGGSSSSSKSSSSSSSHPAALAPDVWQLVDSCLPVGGFAHSSGLEAADKALRDVDAAGATPLALGVEDNLVGYIWEVLQQLSSSQLPYVRLSQAAATRGDLAAWHALDRGLACTLANQVARRASEAQGAALLRVAAAMYPEHSAVFAQVRRGALASADPLDEVRCRLHLPTVLGLVLGLAGLDRSHRGDTAAAMFLFMSARTMLSAAVRLNLLGPIRCALVQRRINQQLGALLEAQDEQPARAAEAETETNILPAPSVAPLLEHFAGIHDTLYSRIFIS